MDYAKKLTERNPDGSLKVVGLDPFDGFYENVAAHWAPQWGVDWVDESGKSNLAAQPGLGGHASLAEGAHRLVRL